MTFTTAPTDVDTTLLTWGHEAFELVLDLDPARPVRVESISAHARAIEDGRRASERAQPLVEVIALGDGHSLTNTRFSHTGVGSRLRYVDHEDSQAGDIHELRVRQRDQRTGLLVTSVFRAISGVPAAQTWTELENRGAEPVIVQLVSSFATGAILAEDESIHDLSLLRGRSEWCAENRWAWTPLSGPDGLPDINTTFHDHDARGALTTVSKSTWSSGEYLPTGFLVNTATGRTLAWQIEHNGAWRWEVDGRREGANAVSLVIAGPNDLDHQWDVRLAPGDGFSAIPISIAPSMSGFEGALAGLTAQRRAIRRTSERDATRPVIFIDYMNTPMGDPTTSKLLPLIDAAADAGAEYFCIDAGWYDDGHDWWPSVGEWQPSTTRFPDGGIERVLDHIRSRGLQPGLWLEPEVVGIHSPMADRLPHDAFLQRYGRRIVEHDRYFLDFRHPAVIAHLDRVVDHLVRDLGSRHFKLDYNVTPGAGSDVGSLSAGSGLLEHNRAHLAWIDALVSRYPEVIFENCASGGMRVDYAMMSRLDLQSTSDQQDFRLYATIAAAAPMSLLPEQAGNWAYPQPAMSDEEIAFTMINGIVGRLYLSGRLDAMSGDQKALVAEGVAAFAGIRDDLAAADAFWPLGLPGWFDEAIALGLRTPDATYLAVWSRSESIDDIVLPLEGEHARLEVVYPAGLPAWTTGTDGGRVVLTPAAAGPSARLFRIA